MLMMPLLLPLDMIINGKMLMMLLYRELKYH